MVEEEDETVRAVENSKNREFSLLGSFVKSAWKNSQWGKDSHWIQTAVPTAVTVGRALRQWLIRTVVIPQSCGKVKKIQRSLWFFGAHYCWTSAPCYVNMHALQIAVQWSIRFRVMLFSQDVSSSGLTSDQAKSLKRWRLQSTAVRKGIDIYQPEETGTWWVVQEK